MIKKLSKLLYVFSIIFLINCSRVDNPLDSASLGGVSKDVTARATVTGSPLSVTETGSTSTFTVVLNSAPAANVKVCMVNGDMSETAIIILGDVLGPDPDCYQVRLEFTPADWDVPKTVYISGVDDFFSDGDQTIDIFVSKLVSSDTGFNGIMTHKVSVTTTDDEPPSFINVAPTIGLTTSDGIPGDSFNVSLSAAPQFQVKICLESDNPTETDIVITNNPREVLGPDSDCPVARLEFNSINWFMPQTVNLGGVCDAGVDGNQPFNIILTNSSIDPNYSSIDPADVSGTNLDVVSMSCSYNYTPPSVVGFSTISGTGIPLVVAYSDDVYFTVPITFTFFFAGVPYTTVYPNSNGQISFANTWTAFESRNNFALGAASNPLNVMAPWWDDLEADPLAVPASQMYYEVQGIAPNRVLVIEYENIYKYFSNPGDDTVTFQVRLYETTNVIEFIYGNSFDGPNFMDASIGIKGPNQDFIDGLTGSTVSASSTLDTVPDFPALGTVITFFP